VVCLRRLRKVTQKRQQQAEETPPLSRPPQNVFRNPCLLRRERLKGEKSQISERKNCIQAGGYVFKSTRGIYYSNEGGTRKKE